MHTKRICWSKSLYGFFVLFIKENKEWNRPCRFAQIDWIECNQFIGVVKENSCFLQSNKNDLEGEKNKHEKNYLIYLRIKIAAMWTPLNETQNIVSV